MKTRISIDIDDEEKRIHGVDCVDCLMNSCRGRCCCSRDIWGWAVLCRTAKGEGDTLGIFPIFGRAVCRHGFVRYRWAVFAPTAKFIESNWLFALPPSPPLIKVPLQGDDILITMIILWSTTSSVPLLKTWTVGRNNGSSSWGNFLLSRFSTFFAQVFSGKGRSLKWEALPQIIWVPVGTAIVVCTSRPTPPIQLFLHLFHLLLPG